MVAYDHRLSDLAPYRELGVWILVAYRPGGGDVEVPGYQWRARSSHVSCPPASTTS